MEDKIQEYEIDKENMDMELQESDSAKEELIRELEQLRKELNAIQESGSG